ncbi:YicC family protein [Salipaludibacillus keqinensis]|uniref:YicC family protein n=1 Tax=Salipaludibacillus keqinensis TaxID=2045207 RepID=A0A323TFM7_9BACI|nr:YicC/YloC family endoribonuclease [Salipaludibacillus keqinensis]PYZ93206.1 YicC family protein [Salipaludibacillus keqinensis]
MIMSMTGYGRSTKENDNCQVTVEMKAVNHRFCEMNIRMPRQLFFLEDRMKKEISKYVKRGKVDVFLNVHGEGVVKRSLSIDWDLFQQYQEMHEEMIKSSGAASEFPVNELLVHEEVVSVNEADDVSEELETMVQGAVEQAVVQLIDMRKQEGEELHKDMVHRLSQITAYVDELRGLSPLVQTQYRDRLLKKVEDFVGSDLDIDQSRILTEVSVFADKSDIEEELTRIDSHVKQFMTILNDAHVVGRKLDFLVQELNRETNTIGSKANHLEISQTVVNLKAELEKIKEQVQNVE